MPDRFELNPEPHASNLTGQDRQMLDAILDLYAPSLPANERAKLREQIDIFTTNATGRAYILGWGQGKKDAEAKAGSAE